MSTRSLRVLLIAFMALIVASAAFVGPAAATTDLSIDESSDLDEGVTVTDFNASDDELEQLVISVDGDAHDLATADVTIELDDEDRDLTFFTADLDSDAYDGVTDEGTIDELHTWNVSHDEFEDMPAEIEETTDLNVTVEIEAEDGTEDETDFVFSIENTDERSVMVLDSASMDDADVAPAIASDEEDVGGFLGFMAEETTIYDVDEEDVAINGSETTVYMYADDTDVADTFAESIEEEDGIFGADAVDDGEPIVEMTMLADGDLILTYANEAGDAVDEDEDTYAVYHEDEDMIKLHLGSEDYDADDDEEIDVYAGTHAASFDNFVASDEIAEAFGSEMGFWDLQSAFDVQTAFNAWTLDDDDFLYTSGIVMSFVVTGTAVGAKRRAAAEA